MKKLWLLTLVPVLGLAAVIIRQNLPEKKYARHMIKARLLAKENNLTAAQLEYEQAYNAIGGFTPYVSFEVLELMNKKSLKDKNITEALANTKLYVQNHPEDNNGRITLAQMSFQIGDPGTAFEALNAILERDQFNFSARLMLTQLRTKQGRLDLAEEQLQYLYRKYPDSIQTLLPLAENLLKQGRIEESRGFLQQVLKDHPKNVPAKLLLVDGYFMEKQPDSAQLLLEDWQNQSDAELARPIAIRRARYNALKGDFAKAEEILAPYLTASNENLPSLSELAVIKAAAGKTDSAASIYNTIGETSPGYRGSAERMKVFLYLNSGNPAKALESIKILEVGSRNLDLSPLTLAAYIALGQDSKVATLIEEQPDSTKPQLVEIKTHFDNGKEFISQWALVEFFRSTSQANWMLKATQDLFKSWPKDKMVIMMYANQLANLRQFSASAKLLENLPPSKEIRQALLSMWMRAGERDKAKVLAEKLIGEDPKLRGVNTFLADCAWSRGDKAKGIEYYKRELAVSPNDLVALNNLAWELGIVQGDFAQARPFLDSLKAKNSPDARIWDTIGWILAKNGKAAEGEQYLNAALNMVPDFPVYLFHMAVIQLQVGKKDLGRKNLEAALKSKLPFEDRKEAETLLAQQG